ncbi:SRPBCC family protein [Mycolicibacterium novocastrense]|uniref:Polyketide cyclase/dehydrase and lipid transport n=1 Tax=Mycolicibacterium novocastrense TaxID=59813 RepID=A0AAW5SSZ9_MYCNV|nr:SRPBCC family protein [Mycolicibacterium novocastrense]MCV7026702.1 SRPBCC family protein [Mycolicibacterium novocastrense]GAT12687.1 polyketide cyclase/dehydrase and lipid transport [Mycolicibacterium novocastrense]
MAKLEMSRQLALSPQEAWEHVSDLNALADWMVMHEGWRGELPDELTVGTTIVGVAGAKGLRNRVTWTIQKFDPPKLIEVTGKGVGGTRYGLTMTVAPTETGSAFTLTMNLGGAPLFGPIGATAARAVKGDIERSIRKFEELYA